MDKKDRRVQRGFYLNDDEYELVKKRAAKKNLKTAVYLRLKSLDQL